MGMTRVQRAVFYPCVCSMFLVIACCAEGLIWRWSDSYPSILSQTRYVDNMAYLTPQSIKMICRQPLSKPELTPKRNGLYLRCGMPGIEGIYRIVTDAKP